MGPGATPVLDNGATLLMGTVYSCVDQGTEVFRVIGSL